MERLVHCSNIRERDLQTLRLQDSNGPWQSVKHSVCMMTLPSYRERAVFVLVLAIECTTLAVNLLHVWSLIGYLVPLFLRADPRSKNKSDSQE